MTSELEIEERRIIRRRQERISPPSEGVLSPKFLETKTKPHVPFAGRVYGEICYYISLIGLVIGIIGCVMAINGYTVMKSERMITEMWKGKTIQRVWQDAGGMEVPHNGYWFTQYFPKGDAVAELGITIIALAAIGGMMGIGVVLFSDKNYLYLTFTIIVFLIMLSTMTGVLRVR